MRASVVLVATARAATEVVFGSTTYLFAHENSERKKSIMGEYVL